jgi:hypothetical protein
MKKLIWCLVYVAVLTGMEKSQESEIVSAPLREEAQVQKLLYRQYPRCTNREIFETVGVLGWFAHFSPNEYVDLAHTLLTEPLGVDRRAIFEEINKKRTSLSENEKQLFDFFKALEGNLKEEEVIDIRSFILSPLVKEVKDIKIARWLLTKYPLLKEQSAMVLLIARHIIDGHRQLLPLQRELGIWLQAGASDNAPFNPLYIRWLYPHLKGPKLKFIISLQGRNFAQILYDLLVTEKLSYLDKEPLKGVCKMYRRFLDFKEKSTEL